MGITVLMVEHDMGLVSKVCDRVLALADGAQARDISDSSGFPKNTLSRAIAKLEKDGLIVREQRPGGGRNQPLRLSDAGWDLTILVPTAPARTRSW